MTLFIHSPILADLGPTPPTHSSSSFSSTRLSPSLLNPFPPLFCSVHLFPGDFLLPSHIFLFFTIFIFARYLNWNLVSERNFSLGIWLRRRRRGKTRQRVRMAPLGVLTDQRHWRTDGRTSLESNWPFNEPTSQAIIWNGNWLNEPIY